MTEAALEIERATLSGYLQWPELFDEEPIPADMFHLEQHRGLYSLARQLHLKGEPCDQVIVIERADRLGIDRFGGLAYVFRLYDVTPSRGAVPAYVEELRRAHLRHRGLEVLHARALEMASTDQPDVTIAETVAQLDALDDTETPTEQTHIRHATEAGVEAVLRVMDGQPPVGVKTGIGKLDDVLGGLEPGRLYVVAGRPGMGKSAFMQEIAIRLAAREGQTVATFLLEMTAEEFATRCVISELGVSGSRLRVGSLRDTEVSQMLEVRDWVGGLPIHLFDRADVSIEEISATARKLHRRTQGTDQPLGLVAIDYLQLIRCEIGRGEVEASAIGRISRACKILAKDLEVPVILVSQLNRGVEQRQDKRPTAADLRSSGAIEQDADAILMLYRDAVFNESADPEAAEVLVVKNRTGPCARVPLRFVGSLFRFTE